jgi:hypothetical protein
MSYLDDTHMAQIDAAATRRAQAQDWRDTKPTKHEPHVAHAVMRDGTLKRIEVLAADRKHASAKVFAQFPPCSIESVSCWPIRGEAKVTLDALSLRISPNPAWDSAFGCLV